MTTAAGTADADTAVLQLLRNGAAACRQTGRPDLTKTLEIAAARMRRPTTIVCVVGEYKQGKSHVINALAGRRIVSVHDDLATSAITIIGSGDQLRAVVHRTSDGERSKEEIPVDQLARYTVESDQGDIPSGIDLVEVAVPVSLLEPGFAIVDTPGVNAFRPSNERAVLDFLAYADGLVLATDASAELSPTELRFLTAALDVCPTVLVALSKIDLYPEWRRIADLDQRHLADIGLPESLVPISATLQDAAVAENDPGLAGESGFPDLRSAIKDGVIDNVKRRNRSRALGDLDRVLEPLRATEQARLEALEDPEQAERRLAELRRAQQAVARMREASAKWTIALNDGITDLRTSLDYRLRTEMRRQLQEADRHLAESDAKSSWDDVTEQLKTSLSELAYGVFDAVREGTDGIATQIADLIAEDLPDLDLGSAGVLDIDELWSSAERDPKADTPSLLTSGLSVLRGGYSGVLMLSMLAQLAGIAVLVPLSLGAGALFGAKQFRDERKRQRDRQRQEARTVLRQFLDQVQLELGNRIQLSVQESHRTLRDYFNDRIRRLSATYLNATRLLEESVAADDEKRRQLISQVGERITQLDRLAKAVSVESGRQP